MILLVVGVAGAGKSTLGAAVAARLGWAFVEGDALHPSANVAKMSAGLALTDADRAPWLQTVGAHMAALDGEGRDGVVACSALKAAYRARLRLGAMRVATVALTLDPALAHARVAGRTGHFMAPSLVESQFAAWEPPVAAEGALILDAAAPLDANVAAAVGYARRLSATP